MLLNGCGTCKSNTFGHSFFWSDTCEFTNITIKKVNKQVLGKNEWGIKLSTKIFAGVDDCPCFTTFYCYDPY